MDKYKSDICLIFQDVGIDVSKRKKNILDTILLQNNNIEKGLTNLIKYTIKFCIKNNMKLLVPYKRDKKVNPEAHKIEIEFLKRNLNEEEFAYIEKNTLEKETNNFSSYKAMLNCKVLVSTYSTLLNEKFGIREKIFSCNLTKEDRFNFPLNGVCTLNNCSYDEFEKRLLQIYSIPTESYFSKIDKRPEYLMKHNTKISSIISIKKKLFEFGVKPH